MRGASSVPVVPVPVVLIALVLLAACDAGDHVKYADEVASPFQSCPGTAVDAAMVDESAPDVVAVTGAGEMIAPVTLPCFTGGQGVDLGRLGRPAVINLWASWCAPCRAELPEFQRLADAADDRLTVLGVVSGDTRAAAASLAEDLGLSFPTVFDGASQLQRSVAPMVLPVTAFVDAGGRLRYVDTSGQLTLAALTDLVRRHLGVVV